MSRKHEGISCDFCHKSGFSLRRYKCLLCYDYDLCGSCFDSKKESNNHRNEHPMQCLLTKYDYGTFYAGEVQSDLAFSYTCPICGQLGHTVSSLITHINSEHDESNLEVICPVCASLSDGNANQQTRNLSYHITSKHNQYLPEVQETSPKSARRSLKSFKNIIEPSAVQPNANKIKKTMLPNNSSVESFSGQNLTLSNASIFTTQDHGSFGTSDEPLLHTLLNHLYTWRTRREHLSFGKGQPDGRRSQEAHDNAAALNDEGADGLVSTTLDGSSNQSSVVLSRSRIKNAGPDTNKNLRRKLGSKRIIDLTSDNWRLVDPDNDLFGFDDDDLENISLNLNPATLQPNEMDDTEYLDDDDDIASLIPWGQDIGPESIFNQLKNFVEPKSNAMSSNNSFVRISQNPNNSKNNFYEPSLFSDSVSLKNPEFKLPNSLSSPDSCEFFQGDRSLTTNVADLVGPQGFLSRDVQHFAAQESSSDNRNTAAQRSRFIRDIVMSTFVQEFPCDAEPNNLNNQELE